MSSFDEVFKRRDEEALSAADRRLSADERQRSHAFKLVPQVRQSLESFARTLSSRGIVPTTDLLEPKSGIRSWTKPRSPAGYVIHARRSGPPGVTGYYQLATVTPDGSLWCYHKGIADRYVEITPELLMNPEPEFALMHCSVDGTGVLHGKPHWDEPDRTFDEALAQVAMTLISRK